MDLVYLLVNVLTQTIFIVIIITLFYFFYVPFIEKNIVKKQVDDIVKNLADDIHIFLPKEQLDYIKDFIKTILPNIDFSQKDKEVEENNRKVLKKAFLYIGISIIIGILILFFLHYKYSKVLNFKQIYITNIFLSLGVAITYFLFVSFIIGNYKAADPNYVKFNLLNVINKFIRT